MNIWLPADEPGCTNAVTESIYWIHAQYSSLAMRAGAFARSAPALLHNTLQRDCEL